MVFVSQLLAESGREVTFVNGSTLPFFRSDAYFVLAVICFEDDGTDRASELLRKIYYDAFKSFFQGLHSTRWLPQNACSNKVC